jgi:hypothetical protein
MSIFRSAAVVVVLLLVALLDAPVVAQGARGLPDPISSSQLVGLLEVAGWNAEDPDAIAVPIDRYQDAFRTLREGAIENWLADRRAGDAGGLFETSGVERAKDDATGRRQLAQRIADLDGTLFAELIAAGIDEAVVNRARDARARERARTLAGRRYTRGLDFEPMAIYLEVSKSIDASPQWALDAAVRELIQTHDRDRTSRLTALATEAMDVPVVRAELLAAVEGGRPDVENATPEDFERWFAARRDAERQAGADTRKMQAAMLSADRSALERIIAATGGDTEFAEAFRAEWLSKAHAGSFPDRESPASLFEEAREMHESGELDDETFESVVAIEGSWKPSHRRIEDELVRALETAIKEGARSGMEFGGVFIEVDNGGGDSKRDDAKADVDRLRQARADLDRDVRTRLGEVAPQALASRVKEGDVPTMVFGGDGGGEVSFSVAIVADGIEIGGGEPIVFEMDDLGGGGMIMGFAGGIGGMRNGLPRPIDQEGFDRICADFGLDEDTASIASAIFMDYRDGWSEIDATLITEYKETSRGGFEGPNAAPATESSIERAAAIRTAVLDGVIAIDTALFRDLAIFVNDRDAVERTAASRRRTVSIDTASQGFQPGGGMGTVDLVEVADESLDEPTRTAIGELLGEWSTSHTPMLESRARTLIGIDRDFAITQMAMQRSFAMDTQGSEAEGFQIDESMFEAMQAVQGRRGELERSVADANTEWTTRIVTALGSVDGEAGDAFQLGVDRRAWPQCFRDPRSPEGNFDRALGLEDLDGAARVAIEMLRSEWRTEWTKACRKLVAIDQATPGLNPFAADPTAFDPAAMQKAQSDRRRVRFERNEINEKAMRELKSLLTPEQQEIVGELPEERQRMLPPGFGDMQMIIGG